MDVIFGIVSGSVGIVFGALQNKIQFSFIVMLFLMLSLLGMIVSVKKMESLTGEYKELSDKLEKEE